MSRGLGMSRGWVCPWGGYAQGVGTHSPLHMEPVIPWDTVGKRAVRILLECVLVNNEHNLLQTTPSGVND